MVVVNITLGLFVMRFRYCIYSILCALFVLVWSAEAFAARDRCPRHQVKTELTAKREKTRLFRSSLDGINDYLQSHSVLAFVQNPLRIDPEFQFTTQELGEGKYCVMLDKVRVRYVASPRIVMPSEFKRNSCEYKIILKHEKRHLQVHYDYHENSVGQYKAYLGRIARDVPIHAPVSSEEEAQVVKQEIANYFAEAFFSHVQSSIDAMHVLQQKIDSPQEYVFTSRKINRCSADEALAEQPTKRVFQDYRHNHDH